MTHPTDARAWELAQKIDAEYDGTEPEPEILMTPGMLSLLVRALLAEQARTEPDEAHAAMVNTMIGNARRLHRVAGHLKGGLPELCNEVRSVAYEIERQADAAPLLKAEQAKDAAEDAELMEAIKSGNAILIDWPMEPVTPQEALKLMDMMDAEYAKTMGKPAPDREMAVSMERVQHMACDLWAWQKDAMREAFNEAIRAARAAERKEQ